jgi:hypothetical protein
LLEKSRKAKISPNPAPNRTKKPDSSIKKRKKIKGDPSWRIYQTNFVEKGSRLCEPGAVNFSAGWFAQGHMVRMLF